MNNQYDLPLNKDITARFLPKIVALMVYLGTLCFVFTLFMIHSAASWEKEFTTHLSIEIPTLNDRSSSALQSKVLAFLNKTPGIQRAAAVPQKEMATLFRSLLGDDINLDLFALPVVIEVSLEKGEEINIAALETHLKGLAPHIHLTDQRPWQTQVSNLIQTIVFVAFFITTLTLLTALITATFATKTSLLIHHQVIEVLNLIGATHTYIAKQFQIYTLKQSLVASGLGSSCAFLTFFALVTLLEKAGLPFILDSSFFSHSLCIFGLAPFLIAFAMMISVRFAVLKALRP